MKEAARFLTPDGKFTLLIEPSTESGGDAIGFEGFPWHTHVDLLSVYEIEPQIETADQFIEELREERLVMVIASVDGRIRDVWVTDNPEDELKYLSPGENLALRYWSGKPYYAG